MLRPGFPRLSHPEVAHAIPSVGFMAQVYRRVRLLVSPTIVGVQLTDQQRTAQAPDNPRWGYTRIRGALSNLGHTIARTAVKRILHDHGVDPAPERSRHMPWKTFLQAHWEGLLRPRVFLDT